MIELHKWNFDDDAVVLAGFDRCIIGEEAKTGKIVYAVEKILDELMTNLDMDGIDAVEYYEHNIECAYMGEKTPVYVWEYAQRDGVDLEVERKKREEIFKDGTN